MYLNSFLHVSRCVLQVMFCRSVFLNKSSSPFERRLLSTMSSPNTYVKRTTLFKVPEADIDLVLTQYETLRQTAKKVSPSTYSSALIA